ncbi:MAG: hypothetical protein KBT04_03640, partial [Bacteroidales bacterium]|nr:hypothetical protein [Candidatus Colimorpha onthohippi]
SSEFTRFRHGRQIFRNFRTAVHLSLLRFFLCKQKEMKWGYRGKAPNKRLVENVYQTNNKKMANTYTQISMAGERQTE